jgi:ankyrin repeat protein
MNQPSRSSANAEDIRAEVPETLLRLREHWWCALDDRGYDIPLEAVNQLNAIGEAPIHIAAWRGSPEDLKWLIENGADVAQRGDFEMTPLHYAYMGGKRENINALLAFGADPEARCDRGLRPTDGREP